MNEWSRRILAGAGMGLLWAAAWAAVGGWMALVDPRAALSRLWLGPPIGFSPGLVAGVIFSVVLGLAASGRKLLESSLPVAIACGGLAGLLVGMLPFAINEPPREVALWRVGLVVMGSMALLGAASAAGSLALARGWRAARR